jgi:hypothetical protein
MWCPKKPGPAHVRQAQVRRRDQRGKGTGANVIQHGKRPAHHIGLKRVGRGEVMFKFFRTAKAAAFVENMLTSFIKPANVFGPIPDSIYEDPYVLGYLMALATSGAAMANDAVAGGKLSIADAANVALRGLEDAAGASGHMAVSNVLKYKDNAQFQDGYRHGDRMIGVMFGLLTAENDPAVAGAFEAVPFLKTIAGPGASEKELAAQHLHVSHFNSYIHKKHLNL